MTYTPTEQANIEAVQRLYDAENAGDLDAYAACLAPDVEIWVNGRQTQSSREGQREAASATQAAFPDWRHETVSLAADGEVVILRWRGGGMHSAPFAGMPASDRRIEFSGTTSVEIKSGLMQRVWIDMDMAGPLRRMTAPKEGQS